MVYILFKGPVGILKLCSLFIHTLLCYTMLDVLPSKASLVSLQT